MKTIAITGASGQIGHFLSFLVAKGDLFDSEPISLRLFVKPEHLDKCLGLQMEIEDCCFPLLSSVQSTSRLEEAFEGADLVFFAGAKICKSLQERERVCQENWASLASQGKVLNRAAHSKTLSFVIANPCNTNAYVLSKNAPDIPPENFHAVVKVDELRATHFSKQKTVVWGNHSPTIAAEGKRGLVEFIQSRGMQVTQMKGGVSSGISAAWAAIRAAKSLYTKGEIFCSGVYSQANPYGIDQDLFFSFPCISLGEGNYRIAKEILPSPAIEHLIRNTEKELIEERALIKKPG